MKNKLMHTLFFCGLSFLTFGQLPRIVLQPHNGGAPQVFLNFDDAINAAQANDRLYLSGGAFESTSAVTLDFPIHLIGAGFHPDSTVVTNPTLLNTSEAIVITNAGSNSTFTGIKFNSQSSENIHFGTGSDDDDPTGIFFERCEFTENVKLTSVSFNELNNSESVFNECLFRADIRGSENTSVQSVKSVFTSGSGIYSIDGGGVLVSHCLFFGNAGITNSDQSMVRNTIFVTTNGTALYQCNNSTVQNCLTMTEFFGNSGGETIISSFTNQDNPFVSDSNNSFDFTDDLNVSSGSEASGGAIDGTDMGIYGSSNPAKVGAVPYNPHYVQVEIAPATDGNGNLPVHIKTQAQNY